MSYSVGDLDDTNHLDGQVEEVVMVEEADEAPMDGAVVACNFCNLPYLKGLLLFQVKMALLLISSVIDVKILATWPITVHPMSSDHEVARLAAGLVWCKLGSTLLKVKL